MAGMTLYEIRDEIIKTANYVDDHFDECVDPETGEVDEEALKRLQAEQDRLMDELQMAFEVKAETSAA